MAPRVLVICTEDRYIVPPRQQPGDIGMATQRALIIIDTQNDFCPGGKLPVPHGDEIIPLINQLQEVFELVIATQDWHPSDHMSFACNHPGHEVGEIMIQDGLEQILWPAHCVQGSDGARLHPGLHTQKIHKIVYKGTDPKIDSYSAFFDNGKRHATDLATYLQAMQVTEVYLVGLATDYCVKYSALDAVALGLKVSVITDACRGIDLHPGDVTRALDDMTHAGVTLMTTAQLLSH